MKTTADEFLKALLSKLPNEELFRLRERLINAQKESHTPPSICLLRVLTAQADKNQCTIEEIVQKIIDEQSVNCILPPEETSP